MEAGSGQSNGASGLIEQLSRHPVHQVVLTAVACFLGAWFAYALVGSALAPALFWPPGGIAMAAGMLWGLRVSAGAAVGIYLAVLVQGEGVQAALLLAGAGMAQVVVGLVLLRFAKVISRLNQVGEMLRMVLYGGLLAGLATMPLGYLALRPVDGFWEMDLPLQVSSLVFSQMDSVMVFTTLLLCLANPPYPLPRPRQLEGGLVLATVCVVALLLAHPEVFGLPNTPLRPYPILPFLLWLALRTDTRFVALAMAWTYGVMSAHVSWAHGYTAQMGDQWLQPLHGFVTVVGLSFLVLAVLMAINRRLEKANLIEAMAQRDALVREVHHRIKNNLQVVAGLLRRQAAQHPGAEPLLEGAINQVQSIAVVHGLHGRVTQQGVLLCELVPAICRAISELSVVPVTIQGIQDGCGGLRIKESETVALALILNELISNAVKHLAGQAEGQGPQVTLSTKGATGRVSIRNPGQLPPGFDFTGGVKLGTGLGLVKALMPSPGVTIEFRQMGEYVETEMLVGPPLLSQVS